MGLFAMGGLDVCQSRCVCVCVGILGIYAGLPAKQGFFSGAAFAGGNWTGRIAVFSARRMRVCWVK